MRELNDRVAMWQTYVQTTESVSNRAESINRYMALVQIAIFSSYFIVVDLSAWMSMAIGSGGAIIGVIWLATIYGYMLNYRTKLKVIVDMEQVLPASPITQESAIMKKATDLHSQDATSWKSFFSGAQMMIVAVVTGIHFIAMTWFGWLHVLPGIYQLYNLSERNEQSGLLLWLSICATVVGAVGLRFIRKFDKFEHRDQNSAWFWTGLAMTIAGTTSAVTLLVLRTYEIP